MTSSNNRVLIVGPSWVGDMVMAQSLFKLLHRCSDNIEITVMAPLWSKALLDRMPQVDRSIESPFAHGELKLAQRRHLGISLRNQFDQAIVLPNSFKSALVPYFAGIPKRTGWYGEFRHIVLNDCRKLKPEQFPLMVQRFLALGEEASNKPIENIPKPELHCNPVRAQEAVETLQLGGDERVLAICPGAEFGDSKQWPASHFASLCDQAIEENWRVWIIGSGNDRQVAAEIMQQLKRDNRNFCHDITGKTSLAQAIDLLSLAGAVVSNDSGLMHIAAAVGSPVLGLYGSTSQDFTPPLAERVKSISTDISCRPCFERTCPLGHKRCLTEITAGRVFSELKVLLDPDQPGASSHCES